MSFEVCHLMLACVTPDPYDDVPFYSERDTIISEGSGSRIAKPIPEENW